LYPVLEFGIPDGEKETTYTLEWDGIYIEQRPGFQLFTATVEYNMVIRRRQNTTSKAKIASRKRYSAEEHTANSFRNTGFPDLSVRKDYIYTLEWDDISIHRGIGPMFHKKTLRTHP